MLQFGSLANMPIFFANSFPKSGTHLLTQILSGFESLGPAVAAGLPAIVNFDGPTGRLKSVQSTLKELHMLRGGDISYGHLHAIPEVVAEFSRKQMVPFFLYRDPRDVVISHVHYVTEIERNHVHHQYYAHELKDDGERLKVSILGRPELGNLFPNIMERFRPYLDWLKVPNVTLLRYEDLIQNRKSSLETILQRVVDSGFPLRSEQELSLEIINNQIIPEKSPTFRKGEIGKWREVFSETNKELFKNTAGDLLIQLGYEENNDW